MAKVEHQEKPGYRREGECYNTKTIEVPGIEPNEEGRVDK